MDWESYYMSLDAASKQWLIQGLLKLEEAGFFRDVPNRFGQNVLQNALVAGQDSGGMNALERSAVSWASIKGLFDSMQKVLDDNRPT